jgi:5-methylthioadenosine/S-adenosylhomocysteine deaminase
MKKVETLIHARWVVPVEPMGAVLEDHSLAIEAGRIAALLPTAEARRDYSADTCLLYTSPSPRDRQKSRMPSSA